MYDWDTKFYACVIQQIARREVVRTVDDDVIALNDVHDVFSSESSVIGNDFDIGVEQVDGLLR